MKNIHNFRFIYKIFIISSCFFLSSASAQSISMVIGTYECTTNEKCGTNEYCDIDKHKCINKIENCPICDECQICPEPTICSDYSDYIKPEECPKSIECAPEEHNLDGLCVKCVSNNDCSGNTSVCDNNTGECVECTTNSHCSETNPVCSDEGKCTTCTNNNQCGNGPCDKSSGKCVECLTDDDCPEMCNPITKKCIEKEVKCRTNDDCASKGEGYYCYMQNGVNCESEYHNYDNSPFSNGICRKVSDDIQQPKTDTNFIMSNRGMTYLSARRFCEAQGKSLTTIADFNCADTITSVTQWCHQTYAGNKSYNADNISNTVVELYNAYGSNYAWTTSVHDYCLYYYIDFRYGELLSRRNYEGGFNALCK